MSKKSRWEEELLFQIKAAGLPDPEREYRFDDDRRFRFDFAFPAHRFGIECHGGIWNKGRHVRGYGIRSDCEKRNLAQLQGWDVFEFTPEQIKSGEALTVIEKAIEMNIRVSEEIKRLKDQSRGNKDVAPN